jgi:hypothetical protein
LFAKKRGSRRLGGKSFNSGCKSFNSNCNSNSDCKSFNSNLNPNFENYENLENSGNYENSGNSFNSENFNISWIYFAGVTLLKFPPKDVGRMTMRQFVKLIKHYRKFNNV